MCRVGERVGGLRAHRLGLFCQCGAQGRGLHIQSVHILTSLRMSLMSITGRQQSSAQQSMINNDTKDFSGIYSRFRSSRVSLDP